MQNTSKEVSESRREALKKVKAILDKGDVESQFEQNNGDFYSKDRSLLVFKGNYRRMCCEMRIDKTDSFYREYSGNKAVYVSVGLFHEKQIQAYSSIERAFIDVGMKLCKNRNEKVEFFNRYAKPYNDRIRKKANDKSKNK